MILHLPLSVTIPGSIRSKKNSKRIFAIGRFKKVLPSKAYEVWERAARWDVGNQIVCACSIPGNRLPSFPNDLPASISAQIYYKGPRPDLSGCLESIADCLQGVVWINDGQIESWDGSRLHHDLKNPRTELIITWSDPFTEEDEEIGKETGVAL